MGISAISLDFPGAWNLVLSKFPNCDLPNCDLMGFCKACQRGFPLVGVRTYAAHSFSEHNINVESPHILISFL